MLKKIIVFVLATLCLCQVAFASTVDKPTKDIYVVDNANMLSTDTKDKLMTASSNLYDNTGAQFVIVTVPYLDGVSIEDFSNDLFNKWGIGNKDANNGVLLLISKNDKKFRIEVGSGLEDTLTDAYCHDELKILKNYFTRKDYDNGVLIVSDDICNVVSGANPDTETHKGLTQREKIIIIAIVLILLIILFGYFGGGSGGSFIGGSSYGGSSSSSSFGGGFSDGGGCSDEW